MTARPNLERKVDRPRSLLYKEVKRSEPRGAAAVAKTYQFEFDAPPARLFAETVRAVSALGFSILHTEDAAASVTFNTGASIWSNAGQDMTATAVALAPSRSKLILGGKIAQRGKEAQFGSWGERGRIAKGLASRVREILADHILAAPGPPEPTSDTSGNVAQLVTLAELHRSGDVSDDEFGQAKQRLLDS